MAAAGQPQPGAGLAGRSMTALCVLLGDPAHPNHRVPQPGSVGNAKMVHVPSDLHPAQVAANLRHFLLGNRWPLLMLALLLAACAAVGRLLGASAYQQGLVDGVLATLWVAGTALLFLMHTEGLQELGGAWGEERTAEVLDRGRKRGHLWGALNNLDMGGFDIDHIAFTPSGVLALESKWKFRELGRGRWLNGDLHQTTRNAQKVRSLLRSKDIGTVYDVTPVLVIWGKGAHEIQDGVEIIDGVQVVAGAHLHEWLSHRAVGPLAQDNAERDLAALLEYANKRRVAVAASR